MIKTLVKMESHLCLKYEPQVLKPYYFPINISPTRISLNVNNMVSENLF